MHAFDTWVGSNPTFEFSRLFSAGGLGEGPLPLLVSTSPDLLGSCIAKYGAEFSLAEALMLFAVLLLRQTVEVSHAARDRKLRTLRNLCESAFLDRKRMSEYVAAVEHLIVEGSLDEVRGFNAEWTSDEALKWPLLSEDDEVRSAVHRLEDLPILRGRLLAFDLDADTIGRRAEVFELAAAPGLRDAFGAALLTKGDYSRDVGWKGTRRQLGSSTKDDSWRDLFTAGSRVSAARTRVPLMELLDDLAVRIDRDRASVAEALAAIRGEWLAERDARRCLDWRYYMVRYRALEVMSERDTSTTTTMTMLGVGSVTEACAYCMEATTRPTSATLC